MSEYPTRPLNTVAKLFSGGTPSKTNPTYWNGNIPWLTPKDMSSFCGKTSDYVTMAAIGNGTRLSPVGSIFITVRGMSLHKEIRIERINKEICFNQDIKAIVPHKNIDARFLYFALTSKKIELLQAVESAGHGTGRLPTDKLELLSIPDIRRENQEAIAAILGSLDDKIDLNRRMNETLEAMARAIFKDWFVDFGPTRAKMEGRAPYLAQEIWELFPDSLDDEGKPAGWQISTIGEEVDVVGGSTPSTKEPEFWDGEINWATPKDLSSLNFPVLLDTTRKITAAGLAKISSGLLPAGTVLLSSRAPIGYIAISKIPLAINQGFIAMCCNKRISNVYAWLWTLENMDSILQKANGSTFLEISKSNFRPLSVLIPSDSIRSFSFSTLKSFFDRIASNEVESRTLAQTRDLLLPKLMSGEIRVKDAEEAIEAIL